MGALNYSDALVAGGFEDELAEFYRNTDLETNGQLSTYAGGIPASQDVFSYGGFIGHNWTWDGVVFGAELSYQRMDLTLDATRSIGRFGIQSNATGPNGDPASGYFNIVYGGTLNITDMAALKGRVGYDAGSIMPFLSGGVALIRGDSIRNATVTTGYTEQGDPAIPRPATNFNHQTRDFSSSREGIFGLGVTGGFGLDVMLTDGVILRGEYEMTRIGDFDGAVVDFMTWKTGLAAKF